MNEVSLSEENFLVPKSYDEIMKIATLFSKGSFVPKAYLKDGKTKEQVCYDLFAAICMGAELGLSPMTSIQSICVINGMPALWGDMMLALVRSRGKLALGSFREYSEGSIESKDYVAICESTRIGDKAPVITRFSYADASRAGLLNKSGPWTTHPKRMFQYKARAFNLRDNFTDVLKGVHSVEELEGETIDITPQKPTTAFESAVTIGSNEPKDFPTINVYQEDYLDSFKSTIASMSIEEIESNTAKMLLEAKEKLTIEQLEEARNFAKGELLSKRKEYSDAKAKV